MSSIDEKALEAAKEEFRRCHRNACYPEALDFEAEASAEDIITAWRKAMEPSKGEEGELVERLRKIANGKWWAETVTEAADLIIRQQQEIERLRNIFKSIAALPPMVHGNHCIILARAASGAAQESGDER